MHKLQRNEKYTAATLKLMKCQDLNYINCKRMVEAKVRRRAPICGVCVCVCVCVRERERERGRKGGREGGGGMREGGREGERETTRCALSTDIVL